LNELKVGKPESMQVENLKANQTENSDPIGDAVAGDAVSQQDKTSHASHFPYMYCIHIYPYITGNNEQ